MSAAASAIPLTLREALSGVCGSISLACWLFLLLPQLIENYRNQSAEAISLAFLFVWFLGDVCNLAGALWAGLVPVVIAIGVYFCIADGVLISQCLYYRIRNKRRERAGVTDAATDSFSSSTGGADERIVHTEVGEGHAEHDGETQPLLGHIRSGSLTIPGSMERRTSGSSLHRRTSSLTEPRRDSLAKILEERDERGTRLWLKNAFAIFAVAAAGALGWAFAYGSGAWKPTPRSTDDAPESMAAGAQVLGYLSAVAYLGARIPQIIKNARDKSCQGKNHFCSQRPCVRVDRPSTRPLSSLLHPLPHGKRHLRRRHSVPLDETRIFPQKPRLAHRQFRHNGRGRHHLCTVPYVLAAPRAKSRLLTGPLRLRMSFPHLFRSYISNVEFGCLTGCIFPRTTGIVSSYRTNRPVEERTPLSLHEVVRQLSLQARVPGPKSVE